VPGDREDRDPGDVAGATPSRPLVARPVTIQAAARTRRSVATAALSAPAVAVAIRVKKRAKGTELPESARVA
jgi:hypothetical protein